MDVPQLKVLLPDGHGMQETFYGKHCIPLIEPHVRWLIGISGIQQ
jgi:hypothetical protein